jgi:flavin reductase (DIM6/NTAB) family NADH-FMN oxidoreductase RutF
LKRHHRCAAYSLKKMAQTAASLKHLMRLTAQPVTVITAVLANGQQHGATVSSFTSVSMNPPLVAFSLQLPSRMAAHLSAHPSASFSAYLLSAKQADAAHAFAKPSPAASHYASLASLALGRMECHVVESMAFEESSEGFGASNRLFIARTSRVAVLNAALAPLVWHDRLYTSMSVHSRSLGLDSGVFGMHSQ